MDLGQAHHGSDNDIITTSRANMVALDWWRAREARETTGASESEGRFFHRRVRARPPLDLFDFCGFELIDL